MMGKDLTLPVLRSRSRCGVLGCLSAVAQAFPHHSFCPLPASAHSTVRCHSMHPATGVWIAYCKTLTQRRLEESRWIQRFCDSYHGFESTSFCGSKSTLRAKLQLEGFLPLVSTPKLFLRQPEHKWNIFS